MKILVLGANGRTGLAVLRALSACGTPHHVVAMVRDKGKFPPDAESLVNSTVEGSGTDSSAVQGVLAEESPEVIICCVGAPTGGKPRSSGPQTVRADVTNTFLEAMRGVNSHAKFIAVSSVGAGESMRQVGWFMRPMLSMFLRDPLADHTEQEKLIVNELPADRWLVVRPTGLNDKPARKNYDLKVDGKLRSSNVSRNDVAHFIVDQISGTDNEKYFGKLVAITW